MDTLFNMLAFIRNIIILFILCTPGTTLNGSDLNTSKLKTNFNLKLNTTAINLERATFTKLLSSTPTKTTTTVPTINTAKKTMEMTILTSGMGVLVGGAEVEIASTLNRDTIYDSTINKMNIPTSVYPLKQQQHQQQQQQKLEEAEDESQQPQIPGRNITNWQQKAATVKLTASLTEPPPPPPQPSEAAATTTALTFTTLTMHTQRQPIKSVVTTTKAIMEIKENKVNNVAGITTTNIINSTNSNNNDGNEFKKHQKKKKKKKKHEMEVEEEMTNHKEDKGTIVPGINERYENRNVHKNGSLWKQLAPSYYNMNRNRNRNMNITKRAQKPVMLSGLKGIQQLKYEETRRLYEQMIMRTVNDSLKSVINSDDGGGGGGSSNNNDSNGIKNNASRYLTGKLEINHFINNGNQALSNDRKKITLDGNGSSNSSNSSNHSNTVSSLINAQHKYHKLLNYNPLSLAIATATTAAIESQLPILTRSEAQQTKLLSKLLSVVKEETAKESLTITIPTTAATTTTATITLDHNPLILQQQQQQQQQQQSKLKILWQSLNHSKNKNTNNNNINSNGNINNNNNNNNTNKIQESFSKVTATVTATSIPAIPMLWSNITEKVLSGITSILTTAIQAEKLSLNQMPESVLTRLTLMNRTATTTSIPYVYTPTITSTTTIATPLYAASPLLASTPTTTANTSPSSLAMSATKAETAIITTTTAPTSTATTTTIVKTTRRRIVVTTTLKPPPTIDDYQTIISQAGTHAYLPCNVKQLVKKPISWLRVVDGHILTVDQTTFIADQRFQAIYAVNPERWSLQIKYVQLKDAGTYECQVSTEPKASAIVYLHVVEPKTDIVGAPTRHVKAGSQVKLHCIISQALEPPLFINWFYNQKQIYLHNHKGWHTQIERIEIPPETTTIPTPTITPKAKLSVMASTEEHVNSLTNTRTSTSNTIDTDGDDGRVNITSNTEMAASVDSTSSTSSSISATLGLTSKVKKEKYQQQEEQQGMSVTWQPSLPRLNVNNSQQPTSDVLLVAMPTDTFHPKTTSVVDMDASMTVLTDANLTVSTTDETLITIPMTSDSSTSSSSSNALFTQPSYNTYGWSPLPERTISGIETSFMTLSPLMTVSVVKQITIASLIIPSVQKQDSGNYTCSPSNSQRRTVVLHVLNGEYSASAITSSATETDYQLSCYILAFYSLVTKCLFNKKPFRRHYGGG